MQMSSYWGSGTAVGKIISRTANGAEGGCSPIIIVQIIYFRAKKSCNIRAKPHDFRASNEKKIGQESSAPPPPPRMNRPVHLCLFRLRQTNKSWSRFDHRSWPSFVWDMVCFRRLLSSGFYSGGTDHVLLYWRIPWLLGSVYRISHLHR